MTQCSDIVIGSKFGVWEVVGISNMPKRKSDTAFVCRCSKCCAEKLIRQFEIDKGSRRSCDTCRVLNGRERRGFGKLDRVWGGMRERCYGKTHHAYKDYGGRGIVICEQWRDFNAFKDWSIQNGYAPGLCIDRIDNDGPYSPENCRWTTRTVNANNKRDNRKITAFGETKTLGEWGRDVRCVVTHKTLWERVVIFNKDPEAAITQPSRQKKARRKNGSSNDKGRNKSLAQANS